AKTSNVQAEETCGFVQVRCGDMTAGGATGVTGAGTQEPGTRAAAAQAPTTQAANASETVRELYG
ncbi:hypothetical protein R6H00_09825, partial [Actinotignum timonense]|uniref:hypothetical protein n=1 Tax=Actinotignum timonense TaxID=1870995 RepID=UPI002A83B80B